MNKEVGQMAIKMGEKFIYEFTSFNNGTRRYTIEDSNNSHSIEEFMANFRGLMLAHGFAEETVNDYFDNLGVCECEEKNDPAKKHVDMENVYFEYQKSIRKLLWDHAHHKGYARQRWLLDQILRYVVFDYDEWVKNYNDEHGEPWDEGAKP